MKVPHPHFRFVVRKRFLLWATVLATFHLMFALGLVFDPSQFQGQVFNRIKGVASLKVWGYGFATTSFLFFVAAFTRKFFLWVFAMFFSTVITLAWFGCIILARIEGASLTLGGIALWSWFLFTNLMVATNSNQVEPDLPREKV